MADECDSSFEFELHGHKFIARVYRDDANEAPWMREDGHGEVSDWTSRAKRPGELILNSDRDSKRYYDFAGTVAIARKDWGLSADDQAAWVAKAAKSRNKWRDGKAHPIEPRDTAKPMTRGEMGAEAARRDFERLNAWCRDDWYYVGVSVAPMVPATERLTRAIEQAIQDCGLSPDKDLLIGMARDLQDALDSEDEYAPEDYSNALWAIESDSADYIKEVANELADQIIKAKE